MPRPRRGVEAAARWQTRMDGALTIAAAAAVTAVALQTLARHGSAHDLGLALSWGVWAVFALDAAVMLGVHPAPARWARGHAFDLTVLFVAFPLWPRLAYDALLLELVPAFTLLEAVKLAKLVKVARIASARAGARGVGVVVVVAAAVVALLVVTH